MGVQQFECNACGELTPLIRKTKRINASIRHEYAECKRCKYKSTFFYSDQSLRKLLNRQSLTIDPIEKAELGKEIQEKMDELLLVYGGK